MPLLSARNFTPSSTALVSWVLSTVAGIAVAGQIVKPVVVRVVKIQRDVSLERLAAPRSLDTCRRHP